MKANLGSLDTAVRIIIAVSLIILFFTGIIPTTIIFVGSTLASILLTTSYLGYCPFYGACNINTKRRLNDKAFASNKDQYYFNL